MTRSTLPLAVCLAGLLPGVVRADEGGEWIGLKFMNLPRQEEAAARIGDKVYVMGGIVSGGPATSTDTMEVYDVVQDTWSFTAPMPGLRDHNSATAWGGRVYVLGGFIGVYVALDNTWIYDPTQDSWSTGTPLISPRGACAAVTFEDKLYVLAGIGPTGAAMGSVLIYDPAADTWSQGADMPTARHHVAAVVEGEYIYVLGGRDNDDNPYDANERYHPATDTWTSMAPMPTSRTNIGAAALNGRIYATGGAITEVTVFDVVEVYDVATDSWHCQKELPLQKHGHVVVALDDRLLVAAGSFKTGISPVTITEAFVPAGMTADIDSLSLGTGGTQTFDIHAGPDYAGDLYQVVGSLSGTSPGFAFGSVMVPLNFDPYLMFTAGNPGSPPLAGGFGTLDASGQATAALTLAAGAVPSLAGRTAHHVFGVFDLTALHFVSNPVEVEFLP